MLTGLVVGYVAGCAGTLLTLFLASVAANRRVAVEE
jgi:hypothetical protein